MNNRQEQIEQAKRLIATGISEDLVAVLHQQFPELKESEDERIRKALIKQFSAISMETWAGIPKTDIISYLERQKEQKPLSTKETELNSIAFLEQLGYTCVPPGAEQKPAVEQQGGTFNSYDMDKTFADGQYYVMKHLEKFGLCKPAEWSEEDEDKVDDICKLIESLCQIPPQPSDKIGHLEVQRGADESTEGCHGA